MTFVNGELQEFALTEAGFAVLSAAITRARHERDALVIRIGVRRRTAHTTAKPGLQGGLVTKSG